MTHERFWTRKEVTDSGCWLWTGARNNCGYGKVRWRGRLVYVHRLAYYLTHGRNPQGGCVLHKCDTPACFNPEHLQGGTHSTNLKHQYQRNRRRTPKPIGE